MEIALFNGFEIDDSAVWFDLPNLKTGGVHTNPFNGETVQFEIRSPDSPEMRAFETKVGQAALNAMASSLRRGNPTMDINETDKTSTERAILAVRSWRNMPDPEGNDVPFSSEAVRSLMTSPKTRWMRDWVENLVRDRGNFFGVDSPAGEKAPTRKK